MSYFTSKRRELAGKIVSVGLMVTTFAWLLAPGANAQSNADLIASLLAQIQALQAQLIALQGGSSSAGATACTFTRALTVGARGDDVTCLQEYLASSGHLSVSATGYFGNLTKAAVAAWQADNGVSPAVGYFGSISRAKYAAVAGSVATPTTPTTPTTTTPTTTTPVAAGSGLTVALAGDTPASGLFGESFASRPFTKVNFTASADGDVTVKSVTIERTGQAQDSAFSGLILLDETGTRIGTSKTLNSNHQAVLNEAFVVKAGTTRGMTVAGDSDNNQDAYAGQIATLSLIAVDAGSATVNGTLPIVGNGMTINSTLAVGTLTLSTGAREPGSSPTKEVGLTNYTFASVKLSAGSAEDMTVKSVRWNQSGSAATGDLANVKTCIDGGDCYDHTVSSDGKYYTAKFGDAGLKLAKGEFKDIYIKGDIVSGSGRGVDLDIYRYADIKVTGNVYGYDILPTATNSADSATDDDGTFQDANPNYDGYEVTISNGTITVTKSAKVASQNVAVNLSNQILGGFDVEVKGEEISVAAMNFDVALVESAGTGGAIGTDDITSITLVDANGNTVAGPVDGVAGGNNGIQFTDTVTFPIGTNTYTIKGKYGTDFLSNDTVQASTTPSSDWTTVRGKTTGNSITPSPASAVSLNVMTVKAASLTVTVSPTPAAQNIVTGSKSFVFANYIFDASASGEDIRSTLIKTRVTGTANTFDQLQSCSLFDGTTALTTGGNTNSPANTVTTGDDLTFNLDSGLITPKGSVKTVALKCDVKGNVDAEATAGTTTFSLGVTNAAGSITSTGQTSGQSVTETITQNNGQAMTLRSGGSVSVVLDSSSPALKWVQAGATDQALAVFRVNATYEDIRLERMGLQIASSTDSNDTMASNTPSDISKVTLWNGAKKIGEATFSSTDYATTTFSTAFGATDADLTITKDSQMLITVKGDIGAIGTVTNAFPGHLIVVNHDASSSDDETNLGLKGVGSSSGTSLYSGGSDTTSNGARITKAVPTVERVALTSTKFSNTSGQTLYRFKVSSPAGTNGVSLYKFTFSVSTSVSGYLQELPGDGDQDPEVSGFRVTSFEVYCYSDSAFSVAACGNSSGLLNGSGVSDESTVIGSSTASVAGSAASNVQHVNITFNPANPTSATTEAVVVPAGETRYFSLKASVTGASSTPSITTSMLGDAQFASLNDGAAGLDQSGSVDTPVELASIGDNYTTTGRYVFATTAANVDAWDDDDFIWSGNSTNTAQSVSSYDWFNGFLVPGLSNTDVGTTEVLTLTN